MKLLIVGSMKFYKNYLGLRKLIEQKGHEVILPLPDEFYDQNLKTKIHAMNDFNNHLKESDAIIVANYDKPEIKNYVGINSIMEIGMAFNQGKKVFILNKIPENCKDEFEAIGAIELNGDLENIK